MKKTCLTGVAFVLLFVSGLSEAANPAGAAAPGAGEPGLSDNWLELAYGVGFQSTSEGESREKTQWGARASGSVDFGPSFFFAGSYEQQRFDSGGEDFLGTFYQTTEDFITGKEGLGTRFGNRDKIQGILLVSYQEHQFKAREVSDQGEVTDGHASRGLGYSIGFRTFLLPRLEFAGSYEHAPLKGQVPQGNVRQIFDTSALSLSAPLSQRTSFVMRFEQRNYKNKAAAGTIHLQNENFLLGLRYTL